MSQPTLHLWTGTAVLALFALTTALYAAGISGQALAAGRYVSYTASFFLALQYAIGIGLLASDYRNHWYHYALGLAVLLPLGVEHGFVRRRFAGRERAIGLTLVAGATLLIVLAAYLVGRRG